MGAPAVYAQAWTPTQDPEILIRRAVHNDLNTHDGLDFRFTLRKSDEKGVTTKEIIETKDGDVARLIAIGDKPLTPEQDQAELRRLNDVLAHPEIQQRRHKREQADSSRGDELFRVIPDAFVYKYIGMGQTQSGPAYKFSFVPNKNFDPPDYEARVFHGMAGELWIDQKQERAVRFDAHLISDVEFGWGVLGRLYKGGSIVVEQQDVGHNHWEQSLLKLNLKGKEMMFKDLDESTTEEETHYEQVPNTWTFQDAIHALEAAPSK
jgi:hypothetical protein